MDEGGRKQRYKLYETDTTIAIPKSTYYRRKKKLKKQDDEEANDDFDENECKTDDEDTDEMYDDKSSESENDDEQVIEGVFVTQKDAEKCRESKQNYAPKKRKKRDSKYSDTLPNPIMAVTEESSPRTSGVSITNDASPEIPVELSTERNPLQENLPRTCNDDDTDHGPQINEFDGEVYSILSNSDIEEEINPTNYEEHHDSCIDEYFNEVFTEDEEEPDSSENEVLYSLCDLSKQESKLNHLALALRHNLPDIALQHTLENTDCHLPQSMYISKYRFLKTLPYPEFEIMYYCENCEIIIRFQSDEASCEKCLETYCKKKLKSEGRYFIYIPLQNQLQNFVKSKLYLHVHTISPDVSDIVNSTIYKRMRDGIIGNTDLTLTWNCDGVQIFKKSSKSMTPLQVMVNELPYRLRRSNVFLAGLWMNDRKPIMQMFLKPFVEEMQMLSADGFESSTYIHPDPIHIRVFAIISSVDSVARPQIQRMKQFNGKYGCSYCLEKGERTRVGSGFSRVYCNLCFQKRSSTKHNQIIDEVIKNKKCIQGVKGPAVVQQIPYLDIINGYPPDYMHSCLLGIGKLFLTEWFDSANHGETWYLGSKLKTFNKKLIQIKPPCEITRTPRPISDNYNANEYKTFILYTSLPTLIDLMPKKFVRHWFLFVLALYTLLKNRITDEELVIAKEALYEFVSNIERLYGKRFMKFNVHLLLHIPTFVRYFGALWAWSAFPFENFNGVIKKLFHNTQHVPEQICKLYFRLQYVKNHSDVFGQEKCSVRGKRLFVKLMNECKVKNCVEYGENLRIFGKPKTKSLSLTEKSVIQSILGEQVDDESDWYNRFIYKRILYHSINYNRLVKRNNSCIVTENSELILITGLVKVIRTISRLEHYIVIGTKLNILDENLCTYRSFHSNLFSFIANKTLSIVCVELSSIRQKCIFIDIGDSKMYVVPLVNTMETD